MQFHKIATTVRSSPQKHQSFEKMVHLVNIPNNPSLILNCTTRWNSTFAMINRSIKLKGPIEKFITSDNTLKDFSITQNDW
jgi:hypothetical protein